MKNTLCEIRFRPGLAQDLGFGEKGVGSRVWGLEMRDQVRGCGCGVLGTERVEVDLGKLLPFFEKVGGSAVGVLRVGLKVVRGMRVVGGGSGG